MNLSELIIPGHTLNDFVKSQAAVRHGISNIPSEEEIELIRISAKAILVPIEKKFGPMSITSWFRTPLLCKKIGSKITSNHTVGDTGDIEPVNHNVKLIEVFEFIVSEIPYHELIAEYFPNGWVHCCYRPNSGKPVCKLKDDTHNFERMSPEAIIALYKGEGK